MSLGPENQVSRLQPIAQVFFLFQGSETYGQQSKYGCRDETAGSSLRPKQISRAGSNANWPLLVYCVEAESDAQV